MVKRLEYLRVRDVQGIADLAMTFARPPDSGRGQWVVLLGDNGTGKSTLLRALALSCGHAIGFLAEWVARTGGVVRTDADTSEAEVEVRFGGKKRRLKFGRRLFEDTGEPDLPFVVGYGALRGTALGGAKRAVEIDNEGFFGLRSLFFEDAPLVHAETWLTELALAAMSSRKRGAAGQARFNAVVAALETVLPDVTRVEVEPQRTWVVGENFGRLPLSALSDGYLTSAGWVIDLIARWVRYAESKKMKLGGEFLQQMEGLVLIDEIDLHLHPRWQASIVSSLRETFPRMTFVASTHNPLTIQGAKTGEVWVLKRVDGDVVAEQRDIPPGMRADQILTGDWFGLASTLDPETQALLGKHRELIREGTDERDPERTSVEDELRSRLGRFNETSAEAIAQRLVAEAEPIDEKALPALRKRFQQAIAAKKPKPGSASAAKAKVQTKKAAARR